MMIVIDQLRAEKLLDSLRKKKRGGTNKLSNERGEITMDMTEIQKIRSAINQQTGQPRRKVFQE